MSLTVIVKRGYTVVETENLIFTPAIFLWIAAFKAKLVPTDIVEHLKAIITEKLTLLYHLAAANTGVWEENTY